MRKSKPNPSKRAVKPQPTRNTQLNAQTRRLLTQHYRAKHGVR
jgi:hypothetical protein